MHISASTLYNFKKCQYRPFLDLYGDPSLKQPVHSLIELLWNAGVQHEADMLQIIRNGRPNKTFVSIDPSEPASDQLYKKTLEAMKTGADFIYQGVLIHENRVGRPDLLVQQKNESSPTGHYYIPMDIKYAAKDGEWDNGDEKMNLEHFWQLYFYGDLLEAIQGLRPTAGFIFKSWTRVVRANLLNEPRGYRQAIRTLEAYIRGDRSNSLPQISSQCGQCPWQQSCLKWAEDSNDPTLLYFVGGAMQTGLRRLGIFDIRTLANTDPAHLISCIPSLKAEGLLWPSFPDKLMTSAVTRAQIYLNKQHVLRVEPKFPKNKEIHYDIEDDPTQDFVYLHGIVLKEDQREPTYYSFFAANKNDEERAARELFEFFALHPEATVYHYSQHERSTLDRLCRKYPGLDRSIYNSVFGGNGRAIDLYEWISNYSDWPLTSYGLKAICKYLGFQWSAEDAGGANSIIWINEFLGGSPTAKDKLLTYNREDCMATLFLKGKLLELWKQSLERGVVD